MAIKNEALNSLNSMMSRNLFPRINIPRGSDDVLSDIANGYNVMGTIMEGIRARNDRNRLQNQLKEMFGINQNQQQQGQPQQVIPVDSAQNGTSLGSVLGERNATPVMNQAQEPDYTMKSFLTNAIGKGMLPSNAMAAYSAYIAPLEQEARKRRIGENFAKLANRYNMSPEELTNVRAQLSQDLYEDYGLKDMGAMTDLLSKQQSGLLAPAGLYQDPERLNQQLGIYINPNAWDALKNTVGTNYGNGLSGSSGNNNLGSGGSEYGGDNENARAIYTYLKNKGYPDNVIAGIMGNLRAESQFNPAIGYGDNGTSGGLAQWHDEQPGVGRWSNLKNFAVNRQMDWKDLGTQLDFMVDEINKNYPDLIQRMSKLSPNEAAILFHDTYERSRDNPEQKARRGTYADEIFNGRRSIGNTGVGTYNMSTQGSNIDEQVKGLSPEFQQVLPTIGGILKNKFGVDGVISSGARSKERQMQVNPSAPNSYHVYGDAVDIVLPDNTTPEQYKQIENYFKSTGQFAEVDNHDKGSGYHLHLGGYKGGNIGNIGNVGNVGNVGGQSYQNQPTGGFASAFAPQVVSGRGAILNPMVAYKAAVEQAERQRQQYNADRNYYQKVFENNRNYDLNKQRFEWQKQNATAKQKQEDLSKIQLYSYDELYKEGSPIATLNNLIASPLKDDATDEQKKQYGDSMLNAVNSFAQYNVQKYKDLIAKGYSEQDAQAILRNGITNAVGRSFMASQGGNSDAKKYMIEKAVSDIYYRTMGLVAQDKEALSKPSSPADFKNIKTSNGKDGVNLNDNIDVNKIANNSKQNIDDKELNHMVKKAKLENKLKELIKQEKYKGLYLEREGQNLKIKMGRGITRDKAEPLAKELRRLAEEEVKTITNDDIVKYKNEVEEMKRKNKQYQEMVNSQYLSDAEAHSNFNNADDELVNDYLKRAETSYSW